MIPGGVDSGFFSPAEVAVTRDRVLYVGRLLPHKGIDRLIAALPPELPLTICGHAYDARYLSLLEGLAHGKQVEFITDTEDEFLRDLYRRSWAVVLPSVYRDCYGRIYLAPELMGLTLLEAMACGTPAICSRVGATPEFVRHGETGFVFDGLIQLAEQLRLLAGQPSLADDMGATGRRSVEQEFSHVIAGSKLLAVYEQMLVEAEADTR